MCNVIRLRVGDYAKLLVAFMTLLFLVFIVLHELGHMDMFSTSYREQGFCVSNRGSHVSLQSHAISFYADAATACGMICLVHAGRARGMRGSSLAPIAKNAISLFGHGCGHLFLAFQSTRDAAAIGAFENLNLLERIVTFVAFFFVGLRFMRDKRRSNTIAVAFALFHNTAQVFFLPSRFFFTHVLLAVLLNSAIRGLIRDPKDKDRYYDMEAWLVDVPILLASFGEAMTRDNFLIHVGGHVWFDMVVPFMFTVYYTILVIYPDPPNNESAAIDATKMGRFTHNTAIVEPKAKIE